MKKLKARPELEDSYPKYLKNTEDDETKETGIAVIDCGAYTRFPHFFVWMLRKWNPPAHFVLTLFYLWNATVGKKGLVGNLAMSQIPVRTHERNKWMAAFVETGFFKLVRRAGPHDREGSVYEYNKDTTPREWELLFKAAWTANSFEGWDDVSTESFARMMRGAVGKDVSPMTTEEKNRFDAHQQKLVEKAVAKMSPEEKADYQKRRAEVVKRAAAYRAKNTEGK
jgi:hypothetical protein